MGGGVPVTLETGSSFTVETEVAPSYFDDLLRFIYQNYLLSNEDRFISIEQSRTGQDRVLSFLALVPGSQGHIHVQVEVGKQVEVQMRPVGPSIPKEAFEQLREDLFVNVQLYEEEVRRTTLYFAWVEGRRIVPETPPLRRHNIFHRLFSGGMLLLSIIFLAANILLFIVLGPYAPLTLVAFQFITVLLSDRILGRTADWHITPEDRNIHFIQYELPVEDYRAFQRRYGKGILTKIKAEIYDKTFAVGKSLSCEIGAEVLAKYGFECTPENMTAKTIDVYDIVKRAADIYRLPIPQIVISNTMVPNAAASGPSPSHGIMLITTGLLTQLEEDEVLSVVGHEFSHLKGRDPLSLFGITTAENLLRFYVFWPILIYSGLENFSLYYLLLSLGAVHFIAKFFESRADLESAVRMGQPAVLAEALRKIGFHKLQFERTRTSKLWGWLGWDTHPPIYFRVGRLERLKYPERVNHPMIQSIRDNTRGFIAALH